MGVSLENIFMAEYLKPDFRPIGGDSLPEVAGQVYPTREG
jgi:hypothetical protein